MDTLSKDLEKELVGLIAICKQELAGIRTNRPSPKMVEDIRVEYFDQQMPIKQLAAINVVPPREIQITAWDKNAVTAIVKAIENSGIGMTPNTDGNTIRLFLPTLTDERRKELEKLLKTTVEGFRIRIRSSRDGANKKVESGFKAKAITEDQRFRFKEQIQKVVDRVNGEIEMLMQAKLKEISE